MQQADRHNKGGLNSVIAAFMIAVVFIIIVICVQPGPIDKMPGIVAGGISHAAIVDREKGYRTSTPEAIARGKELYTVNCQYCHAQSGHDFIADRYAKKTWKYGAKETDIYFLLMRGIPAAQYGEAPIMPRMDQMQAPQRWALVHYLRSLAPDAPSASSADWNHLDKEPLF